MKPEPIISYSVLLVFKQSLLSISVLNSIHSSSVSSQEQATTGITGANVSATISKAILEMIYLKNDEQRPQP